MTAQRQYQQRQQRHSWPGSRIWPPAQRLHSSCIRRPTHRPALQHNFFTGPDHHDIPLWQRCSHLSICTRAQVSENCCPARPLSCRARDVSEGFPSRQASKRTLGKAPPVLQVKISMPLLRRADDMGSNCEVLRRLLRVAPSMLVGFSPQSHSAGSVIRFREQP